MGHVEPGSGSMVTGIHRSMFSLTATPILRYMGDYPSRQAWTSVELTDQIFSLALQDTALQDEVYCQILKQLTHNTKRSTGDGVGVEGKMLGPLSPHPDPRGCAHCSAGEVEARGSHTACLGTCSGSGMGWNPGLSC